MPALLSSYQAVRTQTIDLCRHLEPEDFVIQSMPDVSPVKWHLAHTTWFFERFVLKQAVEGYKEFNARFHFLFNSYYFSAGQMHPRPQRGLLSRPLVREVVAYRDHVDEAMAHLLENEVSADIEQRITLGINHEQQHQELLLTDIKNVFFHHPDGPAVNPDLRHPPVLHSVEHRYVNHSGGIFAIGHESEGFFFDNETPRHEVILPDHGLGSRLISNGDYLEFIRDGAYKDHSLWLSDGWSEQQSQQWNRPLYWSDDLEQEFTLAGWRELDRNAPVTHVSYYEADAFARWANARLPTEQEWEHSAQARPATGNLLDSGYWQPMAPGTDENQFFGDVWEWTSSPYSPYPGFTPLEGALGEYNGKFMCNQMTVRGGSCVTANEHIRATYRSFFYPNARWQFLGIRLARDTGRPA